MISSLVRVNKRVKKLFRLRAKILIAESDVVGFDKSRDALCISFKTDRGDADMIIANIITLDRKVSFFTDDVKKRQRGGE